MSEPSPPLRQTFSVHSFDVDPDALLAPRALCAFLQEAAGRDAARRGAGMADLMARGLAWVLQRLVLVVDEWPRQDSVVTVSTWPTRFGGATAERAFLVEDAEGRPLGRAVSRWAVADLVARRAVRLPDFLKRIPIGDPVASPELAPFETRGSQTSLLGECRLGVRRSDLDGVGHVNNTRYVGWGLEPIPEEWLGTRTLAGLDIVYRREARLGDIVTSRAAKGEGETMRLSHELLLGSSAEPLTELETRWRPR